MSKSTIFVVIALIVAYHFASEQRISIKDVGGVIFVTVERVFVLN